MSERIIVCRIVEHLNWSFNLRDSIPWEPVDYRQVKSLAEFMLRRREGVVVTVPLDMNALNTLLWGQIVRALKHYWVSPYLISIIEDYFQGRALEYSDQNGHQCSKGISCKVLQKSILGHML